MVTDLHDGQSFSMGANVSKWASRQASAFFWYALPVLAWDQIKVLSGLMTTLLPSLLAGLLAIELHRCSAPISRYLVHRAARLLPQGDREYFLNQWLRRVRKAGEQGVFPLARALPIFLIAAPLLGVGLRVGRGKGA
jgi:hypothetical protein